MDKMVRPTSDAGAGQQFTFFRHALRRTIHFLSYHFIYERRRTRVTRAGGFQMTVPPTVFHPRWFLTSEFFVSFIGELDLTGQTAADVGTGSGIIALAAARAGAAHVVAIDINPNAAKAASINARNNGLGARLSAVCSNLMSGLAPRASFDVIFSSPPSFAGEPRDLADRAWHAGPQYRDIIALFDQASERLKPDGRMFVLLSSDSDLDLLGDLAEKAGLRPRLVREQSIFVESFVIYELRREAEAAETSVEERTARSA